MCNVNFNSFSITVLEEIEKLVEGVYVVSEVIRFAERLLNTALMSSTDLSLVLRSVLFHLWVSGGFK